MLPVEVEAEPARSIGVWETWVKVGAFTVGVGSAGVLTGGVVTCGVLTGGVLTCGVVTGPIVTDGTVTEGTVTVGTETVGTDTVGTPRDTVPPSAAAAGGAVEMASATEPAKTVSKERFISPPIGQELPSPDRKKRFPRLQHVRIPNGRLSEVSRRKSDDLGPKRLGCFGADEMTRVGNHDQSRAGDRIANQTPVRRPADHVLGPDEDQRRALDVPE